MSQLIYKLNDVDYTVQTEEGISLAIEQTFRRDQPNHFSAPLAQIEPLRWGGFVGNVEQGGSCNVDIFHMVPHCNGTHTESVGHIVAGDYSINRCLRPGPILAQLITVTPTLAAESSETYVPALSEADRVITATELMTKIQRSPRIKGLVIRTLPNDADKIHRRYHSETPPPFFTNEAMQFICDGGIQHLLVDVPSLDRMEDDGQMSNHCLFWKVARQQRTLLDQTREYCTVSEMIFVPNRVVDGLYLLEIQIAPLATDASPSRPILFPLRTDKN